jgi:hypothetical protein
MEHLGSHYTVILHDPRLRSGLIADTERSAEQSPATVDWHVRLTLALRSIATRVQARYGAEHERVPGIQRPSNDWPRARNYS